MKVSTLSQNGRKVIGLLSFDMQNDEYAEDFSIVRRFRVGLSRFDLDIGAGESSFVLNLQGLRIVKFRGTVEGYEYFPATGITATIVLAGEPEYEELSTLTPEGVL